MRRNVMRRTRSKICVAILPFIVGEQDWCVFRRIAPDRGLSGWKIVELID
jgi:hypothetical protein